MRCDFKKISHPSAQSSRGARQFLPFFLSQIDLVGLGRADGQLACLPKNDDTFAGRLALLRTKAKNSHGLRPTRVLGSVQAFGFSRRPRLHTDGLALNQSKVMGAETSALKNDLKYILWSPIP
jgi:hypothetical protein